MTKAVLMMLASAAVISIGSCTTTSTGIRELSGRASETLAKYESTGDLQRCVSLRELRSIKVLEEQLILVELSGGLIYLNQPEGPCGGATGITRRLEYSTATRQLCKGELVRVVENASNTFIGSCLLGDFQELIEKPAAL